MMSRRPECRPQSIAKIKSWPSTDRGLLNTMIVRHVLSSFATRSHHGTVNTNENEADNRDLESQDEDDMGHGARAGGGFTSAVSFQLRVDIELKYVVDNFKGHCITWSISSSEEAVSS